MPREAHLRGKPYGLHPAKAHLGGKPYGQHVMKAHLRGKPYAGAEHIAPRAPQPAIGARAGASPELSVE